LPRFSQLGENNLNRLSSPPNLDIKAGKPSGKSCQIASILVFQEAKDSLYSVNVGA